MTFIQWEFLVLFAVVFTTYWLLRDRRHQNLLLAVVSALFYGWVHPWFLILLYSSAVVDYWCGLRMRADPEHRGRYLVLSLSANLGMLGYFKYCDFFIENVAAALGALGLETGLHTLGVFLPVGISFYTFQTMSYTIDVSRGSLEPRRNFLDYIVFVSFFPQLVAGPVERASNLLPQFERERALSSQMLLSGLSLALWGGFKKVVVADTIAPYVDKVFMLEAPAAPLVWAATLGFAIQILADFSGYTDIARGTSRMLGVELMENFKHPYLAKNPSDFWRRWHVSFSSWIRDYLYIPLGGSRGTTAGIVGATFGAMLLSGLWHGAAWTFVLWGAYHALLLTGYRVVTPHIPRAVSEAPGARAASVLIMFGFTLAGWLIFRETHLDRLAGYVTSSPFAATEAEWIATLVMLGMCALTALPLVVALAVETWIAPRLRATDWLLPARTTSWAALSVGIFLFVRTTVNDFIYFAF